MVAWNDLPNLVSEHRVEGAATTVILAIAGWLSRRRGGAHPIRSIASFAIAPVVRDRERIDREDCEKRLRKARERIADLEAENDRLRGSVPRLPAGSSNGPASQPTKPLPPSTASGSGGTDPT